MTELEKITISLDEVQDSKVDKLVALDAEARGPVAPANREMPRVPLYYNPMVIYTLMGGLAALGVWGALEGLIHEDGKSVLPGFLGDFALFVSMSAGIGVILAMSDALLSRNLMRALLCGAVGLGVGILAGVVGTIAGEIVFNVAHHVIREILGHPLQSQDDLAGLPLFILMVGRAMAWTLVASGMGIGQGVALKSKKLVMNGLVGGVIGGFIGGLAFDPICLALQGTTFAAAISRAFGLGVIGLAVGFFIGLVESMSKEIWLYMKAGPLAGKQFVIYKDPTILGSSPKCDVYLFKDAAIEPKHAELRAVGTRYQIKDLGTKQGIYVNGKRVESHMLQAGDQVVLGETVLEYAERPKK